MKIHFASHDLQRLYEDATFAHPRLDADIVRSFRKKVGLITAVDDERDLWAMRSLRFEKLKGDRAGQHSIRLNDQWRLILRLERTPQGRVVVIIEVVDYH